MWELPNERELIKDTLAWPNWPMMPVKNRKMVKRRDLPEIGVIFAAQVEEDAKITVYLANLFEMRGVDLKKVRKFEYEDLDAMLAAGWVGD